MSLNWQNLRALNNSQNKAFESLCCQLAEHEQVPPGSKPNRVGTPDGGVEYYWVLPNGDELGWQAKFFLSPPTTKQWGQLDKSVKTALKTHPRLILYTICLPIDRSEARIEGQKSFKDKWNEHVKKWNGWAQTKGMKVEFSYWGEHEILNRLSRPEHRGRHLFWFNKELFSQEWFENRIEEAIANVGPRYTPELNVELPIAHLFDGLGRTPEFYNRLKSLLAKVMSSFSNARTGKAVGLYRNEFDKIQKNKNQILSIVESTEQSIINPIDFNTLANLADESQETIRKLIQNLREAEEKIKREFAQKQKDGQGQKRVSSERRDDFGYERHHLYLLTQAFGALEDFARGSEARLVNLPALLLVGNAGTGKTHLFCDIAKQRVKRGFPTILLLGGQFNNEEPWLQIIRLLGLSRTKEDFLGALEAAAQATGTKALILIDALNEGEGRKVWDKHLAGMLTTLSRCPCISIACNVRTSYENTVIPDGLIPEKLVRELHCGFAEHEYQATRTFFDYFGIERPSVPLLVPEFQNPLFFKLFCQGLKNGGLTRIPSGLQGITAIFSFFTDSVNKKLSDSKYLDFDPKSEVVQKAVKKLSEMMAEKQDTWLLREEAQIAVNAFLPEEGYENSLFRHLIAEGLLAEDRYRIGDDEWREGIHFSYERFADHFIVKHLLDKYLDNSNPSFSFLPDQPLGLLIKDEHTSWINRGLVEALSIQLPEQIGKELAEVAPKCAGF